MIYLMRVVDAQSVLDKPGSVVLWTNCHHPFYDDNPYPEAAPPERPVWVGDFWDMFGAGHELELKQPQSHRRIPASQRLAGHPGLDEIGTR